MRDLLLFCIAKVINFSKICNKKIAGRKIQALQGKYLPAGMTNYFCYFLSELSEANAAAGQLPHPSKQ
ncbi:unknown [Prevotella sp. CAG:1031]|nr:unknown [Prevotella sp. CAG:1031]